MLLFLTRVHQINKTTNQFQKKYVIQILVSDGTSE